MISTQKNTSINLQYTSILDSTVFKTVSRVTDQLKDLYYSDKKYLLTPQTIGDIVPNINYKQELVALEYKVLNELDVESVINRMNTDIFGSSLVKIPDPNIIYFIFITCHLDNMIENKVEFV